MSGYFRQFPPRTPFIETPKGDDEKRSVEVTINSIPEHRTQLHMLEMRAEPLNLLDYVYFTIYTITTTGYGDIVPVTPYAKFIASIANLFELFFLVIFFNVLLSSFRKSDDSRPSPSEGDADSPSSVNDQDEIEKSEDKVNTSDDTTFSVSRFRYVEDDEIGFEKPLAPCVFV